MSDVERHLRGAEDAMRDGRFAAALEALRAINLSLVPPATLTGVQAALGRVHHLLGHADESVAHYREALFGLAALGSMTRENMTVELLRSAQGIAIGARDTATVKNLMAFQYGKFFTTPRDIKLSPLVDIKAWCAAHGVAIQTIEAPVDVQGPNGPYRTEEAWAATIPNAEIVAGWDFVISPEGDVLEGANYMPPALGFAFLPHLYHAETSQVAHIWPANVTSIDDAVLFLSTPESHHYGHWIADFLPRLRARKTGQKVAIVEGLPAKHRDMLSRFGVGAEDLIVCTLGARYRFRALTVVRAGGDLNPRPGTLAFLHDAFTRDYDTARRPRRVFFFIRDIGTRLPVNANELGAMLARYGVEGVNPARWTLAEQEQNLAQAKVIISVFGTELLSLLHLRTGSHVVELTLDRPDSPIFAPMSELVGLNHHVVRCALAENAGLTRRKIDSDIVVDLHGLERLLVQICP